MNGNPPPPELLEELGLGHPGDFSPPSQRDTLIYEKSQSQVQPGLVFRQVQPAQGGIMDCDQHRASLTAPRPAGKPGYFAFFILQIAFVGYIRSR
jgi:hypothetical protein